jgi:rhodanese-related sulfurtransferase
MGNHNLLKLVLGTLVIIAVTAGGGCEFVSGGTDSLPITAILTTLPSTNTTPFKPFPTLETGIINASSQEIHWWLFDSSRYWNFIDVRTPAEYTDAHINNAVNIDVTAPDFVQNIDKLDKNAYYIVYCRTGNRSAQASEIMLEHGFIHIVNMTSGISEWIAQGFEVIN